MKHPNRAASLIAVALMAAALTACAAGGNPESSSGAAPKVAWLSYAIGDYQQAEQAGIEEALKPSGGTLTLFNAGFDPQKQQQQCTDAVSSKRYTVIVLTSATSQGGIPCVEVAQAAGIPVISLELPVGNDPNDIQPQLDGVVGSVAVGPLETAKYTASLTTSACADRAPCRVILDTPPGDTFGDAVDAALTALPNVEIVQKINTLFDPSKMQQIAPDAFAAHPDVDVLVTPSDSQALAAVPVVESSGLSGKIRLIGAGGSRAGAAAVADGTIFGTLGTWPHQAGVLVGEMAIKAASGASITPAGIDSATIKNPQLVTKQTVSQFVAEWGAAR